MDDAVVEQITSLKDRGNELYQQGQLDEAITAYSEAAKLLPDADDDAISPEVAKLACVVLCNRAAALLGAKKWVAAVASAQQAEEFDATNWKAPWRQGLALMGQQPRLEKSEMAVECFKRALALSSMPQSQRADAAKALAAAQSRLQNGKDATPLPENCSVM